MRAELFEKFGLRKQNFFFSVIFTLKKSSGVLIKKKFGPRLPNFFSRGIKGSTWGGKANRGWEKKTSLFEGL
jgi:hypothetical protein